MTVSACWVKLTARWNSALSGPAWSNRALLTAAALRRSFMVTTALLLGQRVRRTGSPPCKEAR
jgi:hypothetical protein